MKLIFINWDYDFFPLSLRWSVSWPVITIAATVPFVYVSLCVCIYICTHTQKDKSNKVVHPSFGARTPGRLQEWVRQIFEREGVGVSEDCHTGQQAFLTLPRSYVCPAGRMKVHRFQWTNEYINFTCYTPLQDRKWVWGIRTKKGGSKKRVSLLNHSPYIPLKCQYRRKIHN